MDKWPRRLSPGVRRFRAGRDGAAGQFWTFTMSNSGTAGPNHARASDRAYARRKQGFRAGGTGAARAPHRSCARGAPTPSRALRRILRAVVPPACRRRVWPAAGQSGLRLDPGWGRSEPDSHSTAVARTAGRSLGRMNDRALAALDAYVPMRRIWFLVVAAGQTDARPAESCDQI